MARLAILLTVATVRFKTLNVVPYECLAYATYALTFAYRLTRNEPRSVILKTRVTPETAIAVVTWPPDLPILTGRSGETVGTRGVTVVKLAPLTALVAALGIYTTAQNSPQR